MELISETAVLDDARTAIRVINGIVFTQAQRDAVADRIEKVIAERKRIGRERRLLTRLRQLQSLERSRERFAPQREAC